MVGPLDGPFAVLAQTLTNTFSKTPKRFTRRSTIYDPVADSEIAEEQEADLITGPSAPFERGMVGKNFSGHTILGTDLMLVVARLNLEEAAFDVVPTTEVTVTVVINGFTYKVLGVEDYVSGDLTAAFGLLCRK